MNNKELQRNECDPIVLTAKIYIFFTVKLIKAIHQPNNLWTTHKRTVKWRTRIQS